MVLGASDTLMCIGVFLEEENSQGFLIQKTLIMRHFQGAAHRTLEKCVYYCPEFLLDWEMCFLSTTLRSQSSCSSRLLTRRFQRGMGPCDSILLQPSSPEKEAKDTVIAYTLGETKVKHIQVNFLRVKTFF